MAVVVSFKGWTPAARYDDLPWTEVRIEEAALITGPFVQIDVIALDPLDDDPADPAARDFTTELGTAADLWYRLVFADGSGDTQIPTVPVQNTGAAAMYATTSELALILRVNEADNLVALTRVLTAATGEIDAELGLDSAYSVPPSLATEVCLERAVEHWQQMKSPFGILGLGGETPATHVGRDSWDRHAHKLAPLKESWGLA